MVSGSALQVPAFLTETCFILPSCLKMPRVSCAGEQGADLFKTFALDYSTESDGHGSGAGSAGPTRVFGAER